MRCLIVLPTYNERENLRAIIESIQQHAPAAHVVVVDDESPDGTGALADDLSKEQPQKIFVLHRPRKEGLGRAYVAGFKFALAGDYVVNWDLKRLILSRAASGYVRFVTRMPLTDATSGFKCWRREALEAIDLEKVFSTGYLFQVEMSYRTYQNNFRIVEVPIVFTERRLGRSKMDWGIIAEAILGVIRMRLRRR